MKEVKFNSISLKNWRQFQNVDIQFHENLTILTGANGAGKTTILNVIAKHFDWESNFIGTPRRNHTSGIIEWQLDTWNKDLNANLKSEKIGNFVYSNNKSSSLIVSLENENQYEYDEDEYDDYYHIMLKSSQSVRGLHIPSHRSIYKYEELSELPSTPILSKKAYYEYYSQANQRYTSWDTTPQSSLMKKKPCSRLHCMVMEIRWYQVINKQDFYLRNFKNY